MKKAKEKAGEKDEMRPEYDFSKMKLVGQGIYAERYQAGTRIFLLETDAGEVSSDNESVNRENVTE